ncbi:hypothetical protein QBC40DRAFT_258710 [Triangularia verruculosa]|uniref:Uncharacterized protein n=1 Tax=Triangularia verruculosa TaxID=2587418 RepID=A0AAN6XBW3_9PEZI|nr:hypothetical protein QBC40DRAFT_258710 [Triangularia verruculosa]
MPDHRHGLGGENSPCLLTDYDDDVAVCRETFHEFMARQAEEHWAKEISSLDIESPANRIAAVIEKEVSTLTKKVDAIATAMAVETSGDLASRLFAMIPSRENLIATLDDRIFSKLQLVERSAQQGLAIDDASSLASGTPNITSMAEWQVGDGSVS